MVGDIKSVVWFWICSANRDWTFRTHCNDADDDDDEFRRLTMPVAAAADLLAIIIIDDGCAAYTSYCNRCQVIDYGTIELYYYR